jgi:diguanylate cyclase (GGDEF)-like protein/PAS domain S-box-containing protein
MCSMARPTRLPFAGGGDYEVLCDSFLLQSEFICLAMRNDGTIVFINDAVRNVLGREPQDMVGTNVTAVIHPDDLERAIMHISTSEGGRTVTGITTFRVQHASGEWQTLEVFGVPVTDGVEQYVGAYGRQSLPQVVVQRILSLLLRGLPREEVLQPVCEMIAWRELGSHFAISWEDDRGIHQVSTGIDAGLGGGDGRKGTPWDELRRSDGLTHLDGSDADLPPDLAVEAARRGVTMFRIRPVAWSGSYPPATLTIWTAGGRITPDVHAYGLDVATNLVELILGWTEKVADLNHAARVDQLTELGNRRSFFAALTEREAGGAIVYCDLDLFKPVNDTYGHAAGDALLHLVARRLESCVREGDLVCRLGGDEFAVVCYGASPEEASEVAARIASSLRQPFNIQGNEIQISASIGVAADPDRLSVDTLAEADRALYAAKGARA